MNRRAMLRLLSLSPIAALVGRYASATKDLVWTDTRLYELAEGSLQVLVPSVMRKDYHPLLLEATIRYQRNDTAELFGELR